jgi:hypothetical protein
MNRYSFTGEIGERVATGPSAEVVSSQPAKMAGYAT